MGKPLHSVFLVLFIRSMKKGIATTKIENIPYETKKKEIVAIPEKFIECTYASLTACSSLSQRVVD